MQRPASSVLSRLATAPPGDPQTVTVKIVPDTLIANSGNGNHYRDRV
jgi:hypothetical protein